jgi:hypothetical protein
VYGLGIQRQLGAKFVASIQSILQRLADTAEILNGKMRIDVQKPKDTISRTAASLHLLHHQVCHGIPLVFGSVINKSPTVYHHGNSTCTFFPLGEKIVHQQWLFGASRSSDQSTSSLCRIRHPSPQNYRGAKISEAYW